MIEGKGKSLKNLYTIIQFFNIFQSFSSMDGYDSPSRSHDDSRRNSHDESRWKDYHHWSLDESSHRKHHYDNHRLRLDYFFL